MSVVKICNLALSNIGITRFINDIDPMIDDSQEAALCNLLYEQVRDEMLQDYIWPFNSRRIALAEVASPPSNWTYQYRYPTDCLTARAITVQGIKYPRPDIRIEFEISSDSQGRLILCDMYQAELIYGARIDDTSLFSPLFMNALSWYLSARLAVALNVPAATLGNAQSQAMAALSRAAASSFNESFIREPSSELVDARFGGLSVDSRTGQLY